MQDQQARDSLQFETRTCSNDGCTKTFRVLVTSKQTVCGASCMNNPTAYKEFAKKIGTMPQKSLRAHDDFRIVQREKMQASAQPEPVKAEVPVTDFVKELNKPKPKIVIELEPPEPERKLTKKEELELNVRRWESYVERAKKVVKRINKDRMEIAQLAIEACDIQHGGGNHWKDFQGVYTLHKFAEEIGVHYKTLHNWVVVKRDIKDVIPDEEWEPDNWGAALRTRNKINKKTKPSRILDVYRKERSRQGPGITFHTMVKRLSDARHYLLHRMDLTEIDQEDLDKMKGICKDILLAIKYRDVGDLDGLKEIRRKERGSKSPARNLRQVGRQDRARH